MYLYSWGANSHGQLGLGVVSEQIEKPTFISNNDFEKKTQLIACGGGHSLLLDAAGQLYSCGWNLRLQTANDEEIPSFKRIWSLSGITFTSITCGWDFSCGVSDDNFFFVWGSNSHGQLGLPKDHFSGTTKPVRLQINVDKVSMGLRHTVIINSKGEVWTTGCGKHGQLGLGKEKLSSERFEKVSNVGKVSHVACGQNHTITWSSDEKVLYVWGDNTHGQLLLDSNSKLRKVYSPQKVNIDIKQNVKKVMSGWSNALLWLEDGMLLTWGRNNLCQLGTDELFVGNLFYITLPGNRQVADVAMGSEHTICLATDNTLWAWGWNEHANTGIYTSQEGPMTITKPTLVPIENKNFKILNIFAGGAHNFAIGEECEIPEKEKS